MKFCWCKKHISRPSSSGNSSLEDGGLPSDLMRIMDEPSGSQVTSTYNLISLQQSCTGRICPDKKEGFVSP